MQLKWPYNSPIIPVASDGKFGRFGPFDKQAGFPHQGADYRENCNTDWWWPLSGVIDLFEKRNYGYGYYVRIHADNGWYIGFAHNNFLTGALGKRVAVGEYGGKTGNTGLGAGCHSHIELRNPQGVVVDPEKNIQWVKEVIMAQTWFEKDIAAKAEQIANLNTAVATKNTEIANLKKSIATDYITKVDHEASLLSTVKEYQISIDGLKDELAACRTRGTELVTEIESLKEQIKMVTEPTKPSVPRVRATDGFWTRAWKRVLQGLAK